MIPTHTPDDGRFTIRPSKYLPCGTVTVTMPNAPTLEELREFCRDIAATNEAELVEMQP